MLDIFISTCAIRTSRVCRSQSIPDGDESSTTTVRMSFLGIEGKVKKVGAFIFVGVEGAAEIAVKAESMKQILSRCCHGACKQFAHVMQTISFPQRC